ncbi:MAG: hypothetical protein Q8J68_14660 [Methanolobus sp.]|uniref:hypothetical protein n=1 Tax=Methanolobus sp. TaxID=1874737 RepID=UPI0027312DDF|nr:hypothetical protein [Methanolobus sp.]MDP2218516.1 hypothetical protein [Methanolobus sp.]
MAEVAKHFWASKSIWVQLLGLIGMILIATGIVGSAQWALYCGILTQVLGIIVRFVTKGEVTW